MAITVTERGTARQQANSTDLVSSTFTPAAGSVMLAVLVDSHNGGGLIGISGQAGGAAWAQVGIISWGSTSQFRLRLWASFVGGSPSSGAITADYPYTDLKAAHFFELANVDTSGTVANAFGTAVGSAGLDLGFESVTLAAFGKATNMAFQLVTAGAATTTFAFEGGYTASTETTTPGTWRTGAAYLASEDTTPSLTFTGGSSVQQAMLAVEIKEASGGQSNAPRARFYEMMRST